MRVLIDMDGVVADFVAGCMELHEKPWPFARNRGEQAYGIDRLWRISPEEFWEPMGYSFWVGLPKTREADQIVHCLEKTFLAENLCFLTSPSMNMGCMDGKRDWARKHYPHIPVLMSCSGEMCTVPPKSFCASCNSILIDDHGQNVREFQAAGGHGVLMPRPWNDLEQLSRHSFSVVQGEILQLLAELSDVSELSPVIEG